MESLIGIIILCFIVFGILFIKIIDLFDEIKIEMVRIQCKIMDMNLKLTEIERIINEQGRQTQNDEKIPRI